MFPDNSVRLWDAATGAPLAVLAGHENEARYLAFSPDGSRLASASMDQTVRLWDGTTGRPIKVLQGHAGWVNQVAFSGDGGRIVSVSHDQTLRLWDAADGELIAVLRGHAGFVWAVAYQPRRQADRVGVRGSDGPPLGCRAHRAQRRLPRA